MRASRHVSKPDENFPFRRSKNATRCPRCDPPSITINSSSEVVLLQPHVVDGGSENKARSNSFQPPQTTPKGNQKSKCSDGKRRSPDNQSNQNNRGDVIWSSARTSRIPEADLKEKFAMDMGNLLWRPTLCGTADAASHGMQRERRRTPHNSSQRVGLARQRSASEYWKQLFPVSVNQASRCSPGSNQSTSARW